MSHSTPPVGALAADAAARQFRPSALGLAIAALVALSVLTIGAAAPARPTAERATTGDLSAVAQQAEMDLSAVAQRAKAETRALWVTRSTLTSPESIHQMVRAADAGGFNTLVVQVRGRGDSYYSGTIEPRASELAAKPAFDPLATVLADAHELGLKVHAWVAVNLVSSSVTLPAAREHVIYRSPEWLMVPQELAAEMRKVDVRSPAYIGRLARWTRANSATVEGLFTSPVHPGAQAHVAAVLGELVQKYPVDGVHLDYVRFPNERFDYSPSTLDLFKTTILPGLTDKERRAAAAREVLDPAAYPNLFPDRWDEFRRNGLTELVVKARTAVKAARPGTILSAAVVPDAGQAATSRQQDWRGWLDQSLLDVLVPMAYTTDLRLFQEQVTAARNYAGEVPVWAGIGAYHLAEAQTLQHISAARRLGAGGIILFSYDALTAPPNSAGSLSELGRAAFGAGSH
ncbi:MAG: glycoside hydrolase family 10 protein [Vicinamibacterales bacterium]